MKLLILFALLGTVVLGEDCQDKNFKCDYYFQKDYCFQYEEWMKDNCRKSCGYCKVQNIPKDMPPEEGQASSKHIKGSDSGSASNSGIGSGSGKASASNSEIESGSGKDSSGSNSGIESGSGKDSAGSKKGSGINTGEFGGILSELGLNAGHVSKISVSYGGYKVNFGNYIDKRELQFYPYVQFGKAVQSGEKYTLLMIDLDAPDVKNPKWKSYVHWAAKNLGSTSIPRANSFFSYEKLDAEYASGDHRIVFLLFQQNGDVTFPQYNRDSFDVAAFATSNNLELVGGNFFLSGYF